jgi:hypothetical protein
MDDLKQMAAFISKIYPWNDGDLQSGIEEIIASEGQINMWINGARRSILIYYHNLYNDNKAAKSLFREMA